MDGCVGEWMVGWDGGWIFEWMDGNLVREEYR